MMRNGKVNHPSSSHKRPRPRRRMKPIGQLIEFLRLQRKMSLTEFAKAAGLSHPVLSAIAYGQKRLTLHVLEKLEMNLGLSKSDLERLQEVAIERYIVTDRSLADLRAAKVPEDVLSKISNLKGQDFAKGPFLKELAKKLPEALLQKYGDLVLEHAIEDDVLLTDRVPVPAEYLFRLEDRPDADQCLILDPAPLEKSESKYREIVVRNLRRGCQYTYFTTDPMVELIKMSLLKGLEASQTSMVDVKLEFVVVPEKLHPDFFIPVRSICHLKTKKPQIEGSWAFRERDSPSIEWGVLMDPRAAKTLWDRYQRILDRLRMSADARTEFFDEPLEFKLIPCN